MLELKPYQFWFVVGSQHLYGEEKLQEVRENSKRMAEELNKLGILPYTIQFKGVLSKAEEISQLTKEANNEDACAGLITWMHTFSPGKMWIAGLTSFQKPLLQFHTQYHQNLPWGQIDMDFMNLHQSAHGDREYGYTLTRLRIPRKVVSGYWKSKNVQRRIADWMSTAVAFVESSSIRVARFGDNMRNVAVTEGDKIEAQIKFGWTVDTFGVGNLVDRIEEVSETQVDQLYHEYVELFDIDSNGLEAIPFRRAIKEQARIELGIRSFLVEGNYSAFTTNFEELHGLKQLPGLAVQRLMADGYGFGAEGDWRTSALTRLLKILSANQCTSFMEDYTYHLFPENELILGSHMLEVCPTIAVNKPKVLVHPLSIGGKEDPARLVFDGKEGKGIVASLVELGGRYRLIVNEIEAVSPMEETPHLPVAKVLWKPLPSFTTSTEAWIYAGGAHHTVFSLALTKEQLFDLADMFQIECIVIDHNTDILRLKQELRINEVIYR